MLEYRYRKMREEYAGVGEMSLVCQNRSRAIMAPHALMQAPCPTLSYPVLTSPSPQGPGLETAHGDSVSAVAVTPDGRSAVSAGMGFLGTDNTLRVWDLASGQCKKTLQVGGTCLLAGMPGRSSRWDPRPPLPPLLTLPPCVDSARCPASVHCRTGSVSSAAALPRKRCMSGIWRVGHAVKSSR